MDERTGEVFSYSRKGGVLDTEILAPDDSPAWVHDRQELWSAVERAEKRKDSQLARELEIALPAELTHEQRRELIHSFVREQFVSRGMVADVAMHAPSRKGDQRNFHAHVMLSMREVQADGFGPKVREWNKLDQVEKWRAAWAEHTNAALASYGHEARVDHRSHAARGLETLPTQHEGPFKNPARVESNERVRAYNAEFKAAQAAVAAVVAERADLQAQIQVEVRAEMRAEMRAALVAREAERQTARDDLAAAQAEESRLAGLLAEKSGEHDELKTQAAGFDRDAAEQLRHADRYRLRAPGLHPQSVIDEAVIERERIDAELPRLDARVRQVDAELAKLSALRFLRRGELERERDDLAKRSTELRQAQPDVAHLAGQLSREHALARAQECKGESAHAAMQAKLARHQAGTLLVLMYDLRKQYEAAKTAVVAAVERLRVAMLSPAERVADQVQKQAAKAAEAAKPNLTQEIEDLIKSPERSRQRQRGFGPT